MAAQVLSSKLHVSLPPPQPSVAVHSTQLPAIAPSVAHTSVPDIPAHCGEASQATHAEVTGSHFAANAEMQSASVAQPVAPPDPPPPTLLPPPTLVVVLVLVLVAVVAVVVAAGSSSPQAAAASVAAANNAKQRKRRRWGIGSSPGSSSLEGSLSGSGLGVGARGRFRWRARGWGSGLGA